MTRYFWALKQNNWNWNQTFWFPLYLLIDHLEITRLHHQTKLCVPVDDLLKKTLFEHAVPRVLWGIPRPISHINTAVGSLLAVYNAARAYAGHWLCGLFIIRYLIEPSILNVYVPTHPRILEQDSRWRHRNKTICKTITTTVYSITAVSMVF